MYATKENLYHGEGTVEQRQIELAIARFGRDLWKRVADHEAADEAARLDAIKRMAHCAEIMSNCEEEIDNGREIQETDTKNSPVPEPEA